MTPLVAVAEQVGVKHQLGAKFTDREPMHEDEYAGESRRVGFPLFYSEDLENTVFLVDFKVQLRGRK